MRNLLIYTILLTQLAMIDCPRITKERQQLEAVSNKEKKTPTTFLEATPTTPVVVQINQQKLEIDKKNYDSIQQVDFKNFSYDWFPAWDEKYRGKGKIVLNNGVWEDERSPRLNRAIGFDFSFIQYGDLTGDKQDEAIIVLTTQTQGNSFPHVIFVYGLNNKKPRLLWVYETGDRADEGLRAIKIADNYLLIDQYSSTYKTNEGQLTATGACCPKQYHRNFYKWNGKTFIKRKSDLYPNEYGDARILLNNKP